MTEREVSLLEYAWVIICNAGNGDWTNETPQWQEAAAKFRDEYHEWLNVASHKEKSV